MGEMQLVPMDKKTPRGVKTLSWYRVRVKRT